MQGRSQISIRRLFVCLAAASLTLLSFQAVSQVPDERKITEISRTSTRPTLDGVLNDATWADATVIEDLHQFDPVDHGEPSEKSVFYVAYDDDYLYVAALLSDSDPSLIAARQLIQDQSLSVDDRIEVVIDPYNNMRAGYKFEINPNGVRRDGIYDGPERVNSDWNGIWNAEASFDDQGWIAEIEIPFKSLNFDPTSSDWGFTVGRSIPRKKERIAWSSFGRNLNPSTSGVLSGISGLDQGKGLDIVPSLITSSERNFETGEEFSETDPSLDVFYNFTPNLRGVATFNTDFSATEVDDRQVNLSRFSAFLPEKRDFFLQDVDIFSFGPRTSGGGGRGGRNGMPFFSRRIGLSDRGQPVDINVGGKLSGRAGPFDIGVLAVNQEGYEGRNEFIEYTDLFVARISTNVLTESTVGMIITDGNPRSNLDNTVAGLDFRYRNSQMPKGRTAEGAVWYQASDTQGITQNQSSYGFDFDVSAAEGFFGKVEYEVLEENFNPALGFVNRSNFERKRFFGGYRYRPTDHPWLRVNQIFVSLQQYDNVQTGALETQSLFLRPFRVENHRGDRFSIQLQNNREVLTAPFEISDGVIIAPGDYSFSGYAIDLDAAGERTFAPTISIGKGDFYDGTRTEVEIGVDWRPNSRWFVGTSYEYNDIVLPSGAFTTRLVQLRANLAFNVRWSWVNLIQYDNISDTVGVNSRLRWNPRAGEDLYIVWNQQSYSPTSFAHLSSLRSSFSIKYSRTLRF
ncbi:MAG: sugar-binding protein [Candidatus Rariloculaceae bacterium]